MIPIDNKSTHESLHDSVKHQNPDEPPRWLDDPANIDHIVKALYVACAMTVIVDIFIHRHGHFWFENIFAFHAVFGFLSYVFLIFVAKRLRRLLKRPENYYDE